MHSLHTLLFNYVFEFMPLQSQIYCIILMKVLKIDCNSILSRQEMRFASRILHTKNSIFKSWSILLLLKSVRMRMKKKEEKTPNDGNTPALYANKIILWQHHVMLCNHFFIRAKWSEKYSKKGKKVEWKNEFTAMQKTFEKKEKTAQSKNEMNSIFSRVCANYW